MTTDDETAGQRVWFGQFEAACPGLFVSGFLTADMIYSVCKGLGLATVGGRRLRSRSGAGILWKLIWLKVDAPL